MSILDIFYVEYRANAEKARKETQEYDKANKDLERTLKHSTEQSDVLGASFVKLAEKIGQVAGAYVGFEFIKNGVINQANYNAQLYITSTLYKQHAGQLKEMAQAAAQAGGTREGALHDLTSLAGQARARGQVFDPDKYMENLRARYKAAAGSPMLQQALLTQTGFTDQGLQMQVAMGQTEYDALKKSKAAVNITDKEARLGFENNAAVERNKGAQAHAFTTLDDVILPKFDKILDKFSNVVNKMANSPLATSLAAGGSIIAGIIGLRTAVSVLTRGLSALPLIGRLFAAGGAVAEGGAAVAGGGAVAAALGVGLVPAAATLAAAGAIGYGIGKVIAPLFYKLIDAWNNRDVPDVIANPYAHPSDSWTRPSAGYTKAYQYKNDDMKFWMGKGYSKEQAAGMVAQAMFEDPSGDPNQKGDNGAAKGQFQWHKARRDAILAGTGIDVYNTDHKGQLEAAYWEMQNGKSTPGFDDKTYRGIKDASLAGAYASRYFENPASRMQDVYRGQAALSLASSYQPATVNIGAITINAPGADSKELSAHLKGEIANALQNIQSKADNGRAN